MVKMIPPGKKSDYVDVLPQSVKTMERKGWKELKPETTKVKGKDNGKS